MSYLFRMLVVLSIFVPSIQAQSKSVVADWTVMVSWEPIRQDLQGANNDAAKIAFDHAKSLF